MRADLSPGVKHRLVDRVTRRAELGGQRVEGNPVDDDRDEDAPLPLAQRLGDGPAERTGQFAGLGVLRGVGTEPVRDAFLRIAADLHWRIAPVMAAELG